MVEGVRKYWESKIFFVLRPSLAGGMSTSRRMSELKRASGRGSLIGSKTVKDTRNLQDKKVQQELTRRLLDFLRQYQYPSALTSKDFPPSSKEFVHIFNFLYSIIDLRNPAIIGTTNKEDDIVKVMKTLHYPGMMSKSQFKTIVPHSWPTVLGCLSYLCDVATIFRYVLCFVLCQAATCLQINSNFLQHLSFLEFQMIPGKN